VAVPRVSVVVPAFNQSGFLRLALQSALAQTFDDLEVVVVDDGSTDDTARICASFDDPRLVYRWQANDGTKGIGARNQAMLSARGEWIALLDQDDLWAPTKLQRQLQALQADPQAGLCFCRVRFIDAQGRPCGDAPVSLPSGEVFHDLLAGNRYHASSGVFRRSLLARAGLPHESVGLADWVLWASLARHTRVVVVDEALADYRVHAAGYQEALKADNRYRFWLDQWQAVRALAPRCHPGCVACSRALRRSRRVVAHEQLRAARFAMGRREYRAVLPALRCAGASAPGWVALPWVALGQGLSLMLSALGGVFWPRA
jgi:glycosyltransferase involved in cell wall biosynthesis